MAILGLCSPSITSTQVELAPAAALHYQAGLLMPLRHVLKAVVCQLNAQQGLSGLGCGAAPCHGAAHSVYWRWYALFPVQERVVNGIVGCSGSLDSVVGRGYA
jgi:hypothetical protein